MTSLVFLTIATTVCAVMFRSDKYMDYDQGLVSEFVWKAWNYAASSGCLYELSQVASSFSFYFLAFLVCYDFARWLVA